MRKINNICKNQEEIKNNIARIKNITEGFNSRLEEAKDQISVSEDRVERIMNLHSNWRKELKSRRTA